MKLSRLFLLITSMYTCQSVTIQKLKRLIVPFLSSAMFTSLEVNAQPISDTKQYINQPYHTSFNYPADFIEKAGVISGDRAVTAFIDPNEPTTSVSVVFTPIPADYSRISSFGGKDTLRMYVLPKGEGVITNVIDEKIIGESYLLEYTIEAPNIPKRHVQSVFALRPQESIVALNVQSNEETYSKVKDKLDVIVPSLNIKLDE